MRILPLAVIAALAASPVLADETSGTVLAFDRVAHVIVLSDNTIWQLAADQAVPENLVAGEKVTIVFTSAGENGVAKIDSLTRDAN
ncbi:hypothetical protein [Thetidibacter halocola]|uniref:DUF1344 domain-containing protein n=1 Tax=Thetidibacter halocola TaxID=2827239 RepID=A0A8J7WI91_9RHOB|nr:hypothetical protein [Thetidibacter halocola]MBS0125593.1 hypothetical protein [Thetidibacter halocola]